MSAVAMMPPPWGGDDDDVGSSDWKPVATAAKEGLLLATCLGFWAIFLFLVFRFLL